MYHFLIGLLLGFAVALPTGLWLARKWARRARQAERRSVARERVAEMGTLSSGLAHEIKNPLSTVNLNVQLLREDVDDVIRELPDDLRPADRIGKIHRRMDSIMREVQRLKEILEDFLRFAGRIKLDTAPVDVNLLVDELVDFYAPQTQAAKIQIRTQFAPGPLVIEADASLLKQALLNLLINATQAMTDARAAGKPSGGCGELIIRTTRQRNLGHDEVQVHVIDTGPGMDKESLDKLFQPYFTTKKAGSGLGLPTSRRIIEEHHGHLTVHSEPGRGTDFIIALPTNAEKANS
jgi:signal transduction histidine kinase